MWISSIISVLCKILIPIIPNIARILGNPKLFLNIGPHKTATTSIEVFYINRFVFNATIRENYRWPSCISHCENMIDFMIIEKDGKNITKKRNQNHLLYGMTLMEFTHSLKDPLKEINNLQLQQNIQHVYDFFPNAYENNHNVILVNDGLCELNNAGIERLYNLIHNFDITIIVTYREALSLYSSEYNQLLYEFNPLVDFTFPINFTKYITPPIGIKQLHFRGFKYFMNYNLHYRSVYDRDYFNFINKFQYGMKNSKLKVLDYDGFMNTKQDLLYVHSCELMGLLCNNTKLFNDVPHYVNTRHNMTDREIINLLLVYGESKNQLIYLESIKKLLLNKEYWPSIRYCNYIIDEYRNLSIEYDKLFRAKYGHIMLYANKELTISKIKRYTLQSIDVDAMLNDKLWILQFENALQL